jgi:hypothetical protein
MPIKHTKVLTDVFVFQAFLQASPIYFGLSAIIREGDYRLEDPVTVEPMTHWQAVISLRNERRISHET